MKKRKVLFVDDDPEMRQLIVEFFLSQNYSVAAAVSGKDALSQMGNFDFDVVITDLRMQEMDGLALLREIHLQNPSLPVILITAFGSIETAVEAIKEGASNFVPKPFKMQTLKMIVDKAIEQKWLMKRTSCFGGTAGEVLIPQHHRQEQADATGVRADQPGCRKPVEPAD